MIIAFIILSLIAISGALLAVLLRNLVHAVLSLMLFFAALAGIFVLLLAEFIAAVQLLVYVGAVGIVVLFAIMLTQHVTGDSSNQRQSRGWFWGLVAAVGVLFTVLLPGLILTPLPQQPVAADFAPSARNLGLSLMSPYTITLQVMALLLTAALIGAVVIASSAVHKGKAK